MSTAIILCDGCGAIFNSEQECWDIERRRLAALEGWSTGTCGNYDWCARCSTTDRLTTVNRRV